MTSNTTTKTPVKLLTNDDEGLGAIASFSDALEFLRTNGVTVHQMQEFGDGFKVLPTKDKNRLIGVPFLILEFRHQDSKEHGGEFVIAHIVTQSGDKYVITDGGAGIADQLKQLAKRGVTQGILCEDGLSRSDYEYADEKTGELRSATTYYLA